MRILDFSSFAGKTASRILISDCAPWNDFSRIWCTVLESNKNGNHVVVFVTLFATNFIAIQWCKWKELIFADFLFWQELKNPRNKRKPGALEWAPGENCRSYKNFMPRGILLKKVYHVSLAILAPYDPHRESCNLELLILFIRSTCCRNKYHMDGRLSTGPRMHLPIVDSLNLSSCWLF